MLLPYVCLLIPSCFQCFLLSEYLSHFVILCLLYLCRHPDVSTIFYPVSVYRPLFVILCPIFRPLSFCFVSSIFFTRLIGRSLCSLKSLSLLKNYALASRQFPFHTAKLHLSAHTHNHLHAFLRKIMAFLTYVNCIRLHKCKFRFVLKTKPLRCVFRFFLYILSLFLRFSLPSWFSRNSVLYVLLRQRDTLFVFRPLFVKNACQQTRATVLGAPGELRFPRTPREASDNSEQSFREL